MSTVRPIPPSARPGQIIEYDTPRERDLLVALDRVRRDFSVEISKLRHRVNVLKTARRERMAARIFATIVARDERDSGGEPTTDAARAIDALRYADALIAELDKKPETE